MMKKYNEFVSEGKIADFFKRETGRMTTDDDILDKILNHLQNHFNYNNLNFSGVITMNPYIEGYHSYRYYIKGGNINFDNDPFGEEDNDAEGNVRILIKYDGEVYPLGGFKLHYRFFVNGVEMEVSRKKLKELVVFFRTKIKEHDREEERNRKEDDIRTRNQAREEARDLIRRNI